LSLLAKTIGDSIVCAIAIIVTVFLFIVTERRKAAVGITLLFDENNVLGRREMELVLVGYFLINVCQIFSLGGFLTNDTVVKVRLPLKR